MANIQIWSEINHNFKQDSKGALKKDSNVDAVVSSIYNILMTRQGERVMLPNFASRLGDLVFEPITSDLINDMSDEVKRVIELWDPRVHVTGVTFYSDPDRSYVSTTVKFKIVGYEQIFETSVKLR